MNITQYFDAKLHFERLAGDILNILGDMSAEYIPKGAYVDSLEEDNDRVTINYSYSCMGCSERDCIKVDVDLFDDYSKEKVEAYGERLIAERAARMQRELEEQAEKKRKADLELLAKLQAQYPGVSE